ncbi:MAG: transposase [Bdellovibrionales bacterium]|nr:transposase [Bdellovibrionales bacterium]
MFHTERSSKTQRKVKLLPAWLIIAAIVCQPARFENKHKFWGYCMLVRHIQISGGKIYGNKRFFGRRELRNVFLGAAENVMRLDGELRDQYDALRAKGTDHKDAKISLARKIASIALCLLKTTTSTMKTILII